MSRVIPVILIALIASGCGGSTTAVAPTPAAVQTTTKSVQVQFSVTVPRSTSSAVRSPRYVSASTQSASIVVAPSGGSAGTPVVVNCTTVCSGQIAAPVGSDTFTMKLFDAANAGGNLLSTGTLTQTIVIDQANTVSVTFNGVVASLSVVLTPSTVTVGTSTTVAVSANAGTYAMPALDIAWPFGLGDTEVDPDALRSLLGFPITVMAGTHDTKTTGRFFPKGPRSMRQGPTRHARAHEYVRTGHAAAATLGTHCAWTVIDVPGVDHDGERMSAAAARIIAAALHDQRY